MVEWSGPYVAIKIDDFKAALEAVGVVVSGPVKAIEFDEEGGVVRVGFTKAIEA